MRGMLLVDIEQIDWTWQPGFVALSFNTKSGVVRLVEKVPVLFEHDEDVKLGKAFVLECEIVAEDADFYQIDTSIPYYIEDNDGNCVFWVQKKNVIVL